MSEQIKVGGSYTCNQCGKWSDGSDYHICEVSTDSAASEGVPERVNCGTPPDHIWVHPWREVLYYSPADQPDYIEYVRVSPVTVDEAAVPESVRLIRAAEKLGAHLDPYFMLNRDWKERVAEIISTELKASPNEVKSIPLIEREDQNTSGERGKTTPPADVERSLLPTQESGFFEARIRNQAENIVYSVFGYPTSTTIGLHDYAALVGRITNTLLVAHRASDASKEYVRGLEKLLRSLIPRLCNYCRSRPEYPLKQWGTIENDNVSFSHTGTHELTHCGASEVHRALISQRSGAVNSGDSSGSVESSVQHETKTVMVWGKDADGYPILEPEPESSTNSDKVEALDISVELEDKQNQGR